MEHRVDLWHISGNDGVNFRVLDSLDWCEETLPKGSWKLVSLRYVEFERMQDAMMFILKWT